ncbi:MAG: hypothetical protein Q9P01_07135 [Anaerolineae bacterium]|nr:hypothetical protein [Anaerolineae bacterium]
MVAKYANPAFMIGIHAAQRWFNGAWLMPAENGYSRALPLRWMPAFTEKSEPQEHAPMKEWEAAVEFLTWLREQFAKHGRNKQNILMVADGGYDTINLWKYLPDGVILMARSAKNRVLALSCRLKMPMPTVNMATRAWHRKIFGKIERPNGANSS